MPFDATQPTGQWNYACSRQFALITPEATMEENKPVDQASPETVAVRQGTRPRETVSVLVLSLLAATVAGAFLLAYFYHFVTIPTQG